MSIARICNLYGMSRQNYYRLKSAAKSYKSRREKVITMLLMIRKLHPKMGIKKIYHLLKDMMVYEGIKIGRDALFKIAREEGYLVKRSRRASRTTRGGRRKFKNHLKGVVVERINQAWVSDITYVRVGIRKFGYLFLTMDLYSRKILGYKFARSLEARHGVEAIKKALREAGGKVEGLIHHSDHGIQYISRDYTEVIETNGMIPSMGEVGNAYDNAYAERVIGILKSEYGLSETFVDYQQADAAVKETILLYNNYRPHLSLNYATPSQVYKGLKTAPVVKIKNKFSIIGG